MVSEWCLGLKLRSVPSTSGKCLQLRFSLIARIGCESGVRTVDGQAYRGSGCFDLSYTIHGKLRRLPEQVHARAKGFYKRRLI